jgi:hypothetical protein
VDRRIVYKHDSPTTNGRYLYSPERHFVFAKRGLYFIVYFQTIHTLRLRGHD